MSKENKNKSKFRNSNKSRGNSSRRDNTSNYRHSRGNETGEDTKRSPTNDPAWYGPAGAMLNAAATLSFVNPLGEDVKLIDHEYAEYARENAFPGIMTLQWMPTPGIANSTNSPINLAASALKTYLSSAISYTNNYDASDIMMYMLTLDSVYSLHAHLKRIYGVARLYSYTNRYMPRALIETMGVDFDDVANNGAQLRYWINYLTTVINRFPIPKGITYTERHVQLNTGYYYDAASDKAQIYMFVPRALYRLVDNDPDYPAWYMEPIELPSPYERQTVEYLVNVAQSFVDKLIQNGDMQRIGADILKAYGADALNFVTGITEEYTVLPVVDDYINAQINNATILSHNEYEIDIGDPSWRITVDNAPDTPTSGCILFAPVVRPLSFDDSRPMEGERIHWVDCNHTLLNARIDNPSPEWVKEATRLKAFTSKYYKLSRDIWSTSLESCGSEVITMAYYHTLSPNWPTVHGPLASILTTTRYFSPFPGNLSTTTSDAVEVGASTHKKIAELTEAAVFKNRPLMFVPQMMLKHEVTGEVIPTKWNFMNDIENYTVVDQETVDKVHRVALTYQFFVSGTKPDNLK